MRISQRLYLAILPGIVGVLTVGGLAYWGEYARQAPETFIIVAVIAAFASLAMAWHNTRYVARRVERLAGSSDLAAATLHDVAHALTVGAISTDMPPDELDTIEARVRALNGAIATAGNEARQRERAALARAAEYECVIADVTSVVAARLRDAELPLHVLLLSPFGSLNDNQEELLSAAQSAIGVADEEIRHLQKLVDLDAGAISIFPVPVNIGDLLRPALAIATAHARQAHIDFSADISTSSPRVMADLVHAQEAMTTLLDAAVRGTPAGGTVLMNAREADAGKVNITISHGEGDVSIPGSLRMRVASRLIALQGGTITRERKRFVVTFTSEKMDRLRTQTLFVP